MYRRNVMTMVLQEKGGQIGSSHTNMTSRLDDGGKPRTLSSTSMMSFFKDEDPTISEEVIERVLTESSLSDTPQLTPLSARGGGGGGGVVVSRNIFASLTDPRSVMGNSRLCVNVSRSYFSAKAEMCSLLGRDWLDAVIRIMTVPTTTATTIEGDSLDPGSTSSSPLRYDIEKVLDMNSNEWLGSSSMPPTLAQIKDVLELGLRCADAAIGDYQTYSTLLRPYRNLSSFNLVLFLTYPTLIQFNPARTHLLRYFMMYHLDDTR